MNRVTIDFETFPSGDRANHTYPPEPVGLAVKWWGRAGAYYPFRHVTGGNTSTFEEVRGILEEIWKSGAQVIAHNERFEMEVAERFFKLPFLPWERRHDTLYLLFLDDPRITDIGLKPSAKRLLGMIPEERDAVEEWLIQNQPVPGVRLTKRTAKAFIAYAPGDLVRPYAIGDAVRSEAIFRKLLKSVVDRGMSKAYEVERRLAPMLINMERDGVPTNVQRLRSCYETYTPVVSQIDDWVRKRVRVPDLNVDSGDQLAEAILAAGLAENLPPTAGGKFQTNRDALDGALTDRTLAARLAYRGRLTTILGTFVEPWLRQAEVTGGLVHTSWGSVRAPGLDSGPPGARTGRMTSSPNFQNQPKEFEPRCGDCAADDQKTCRHLNAYPPLPVVRSFVVPGSANEILIDRDYNQQEFRILAHFEEDKLLEAYLADPWIDFHDQARTMINEMLNTNYPRKTIKNTGFGLLYGMGLGKLAVKTGSTVDQARAVKSGYLAAIPSLKEINHEIKELVSQKRPVRTWNGRLYLCEEPKLFQGRLRTFEYKLLNVIIQGSAADCTKQAMLNWWETKRPGYRLVLTAHDELLARVPQGELDRGHDVLRAAMADVKFAVPMLSDGKWSDRSWGELKLYDVKGQRVKTA